jgi:hypothetical protein
LIGGWLNPKTGRPVKDVSTTYWVICKKTSQHPVLQEVEEDAGKAVHARRNNDVLHPCLSILN